MSSLFKSSVPDELLFDLLKKNCVKVYNYYVFDIISFRKGEYNHSIQEFVEMCKLYYKPKYHSYLERKLTCKCFMTILRQICNCNSVVFTSEIKYSNSTYETIYKIWLPSTD